MCYFNNSSTKTTRITIAITNRQSMANVMAMRVQDGFLSMGLPPSLERPGRSFRGLRAVGSFF